ncbi:MAG: Bifunctional protein hldE [Candidatus Magnetoglobus multicellularis str. Araruama]|uniref:Bifunctional protein hldE n=1 Tax=Candidatus Magnetoglobus multicellularis str. Araruama TaxID=890399 RepID=A0A1V1PDH9_9BACT|nr:MAG: Bifunctional protein hldE [Candidatus Magnetoglobus multicellularis str. Araruama]
MKHSIDQFSNCRILVIGDCMIDEYVWGTVERISPEAPVPVVAVKHDNATLGGAGNVVNNLAALKADVTIIGTYGSGENGRRMKQMFEDVGANTDGLAQDKTRATTIKTRIMASEQHVLRIDRETVHPISSSMVETIALNISRCIDSMHLIIISDYGKGLLTPIMLQKIMKVASAHHKTVLVDPKGYNYEKYSGASLITPNRKEAAQAANMDINDMSSLICAGHSIMENIGLQRILITCGKDGMVLFEPDTPPYHIETCAKQVFDVSGAGDTVVSVMGLALAAGASYREAATLANAAAGIVVGKVGTATISQDELMDAIP